MNPQDPNCPPGMEDSSSSSSNPSIQQQQQKMYEQQQANYAYMWAQQQQNPQQMAGYYAYADPTAAAAYYQQYAAAYQQQQQYASTGSNNSSYFYNNPPSSTTAMYSNVPQTTLPTKQPESNAPAVTENPTKDPSDDNDDPENTDPKKKGKKDVDQRLPMGGNIKQMNLSEKLFENIMTCNYYKQELREKTIKQLIQIMKTDATIFEAYSRRDCNQPTKAFCLLLKFHSLRPTRKDLKKLLYGKQSTSFIKCMGLTWVRLMIQPEKMWDFLEEFADCPETAQITPETEISIANFVQALFKTPKFLGVQFPRIPKAQESQILEKLNEYENPDFEKTRKSKRKTHKKELYHPYGTQKKKETKDVLNNEEEGAQKEEAEPQISSETVEKFAEKVTVVADPFALKHKYNSKSDADASSYKKDTLKSYENTKERIKLG